MSLARLAGQVSGITNGSAVANKISSALFGESSFLRNDERRIDSLVSQIGSTMSILSDVGGALGVKNNMYKIGEIPADVSISRFGAINRLASKAVTAVQYWTGSNAKGYQQGVIIDGFDNFKGDINVGLPDNPVMYDTAVTDTVVRNPNRLSMRIYVDLFHSDDILDNLKQAALNSLGGLTNVIASAAGFEMNRVQRALDNLKYIQENGRPFKVYTPHGVYENMMIERIQPVNDQKMNEILAADITFKEVVPTQPLGGGAKTAARTPPTAPASNFAKVVGWIRG